MAEKEKEENEDEEGEEEEEEWQDEGGWGRRRRNGRRRRWRTSCWVLLQQLCSTRQGRYFRVSVAAVSYTALLALLKIAK